MQKVIHLFITGIVIFCAPGLHAQCIYPKDIVVPDGASSTYEEMNDSQLRVKNYMAEMEAYLKCLEPKKPVLSNKLAADSAPPNKQNRRVAMDAMESVAAKFNEQVRAFKTANP